MNEKPESGFKPISPNPFIVGNPVRDPTMFFGREAEFDLVRKRFKETTATGGLIVFSGERRSGKTSILFQILNGRLGPDFIPVIVDMQSMAIEDEADFLQKIAAEILQALSDGTGTPQIPPEFTTGALPSAAFRSFIIRILRENPGRKLILLFDEYELFENKIDAGSLTEDVIFILANLMENESFFLVFTGSLNLDERRRDYWRLFLQRSSIFQKISFLSEPDARSLIRNPVRNSVNYADGVVDAIIRLTAGQPFYTQAICQNIVDQLNEHRTHDATPETLQNVVNGIVTSPFPQMLFMWDGLERDEKLALALLAEMLPDEKSFSRVPALLKLLARKKYPLPDLNTARLSAALESLFKKDMLLKDEGDDPGYAFRIDLWRLWVKRMHSVWQVIRELGIHIPRNEPKPWIPLGGVVLAAAIVIGWLAFGRTPAADIAPPRMARETLVTLRTEPVSATILRDGRSEGTGIFSKQLPPGEYIFQITAPGYRDTTVRVVVAVGDTLLARKVELAELRGSVHVETVPSGARITIDDVLYGASPLTVPGLSVREQHVLTAALEGHETVHSPPFSVLPDTTRRLEPIVLRKVTASITLGTMPQGAVVQHEGRDLATTPFTREVSPGRQRFVIRLDRHVTLDTVLTVVAGPNSFTLPLVAEPPGTLIITGEMRGTMKIDGTTVGKDTYTVRWPVEAGPHTIEVVLSSGEVVTKSVVVEPGFRVEYNYSLNRITARERINGS